MAFFFCILVLLLSNMCHALPVVSYHVKYTPSKPIVQKKHISGNIVPSTLLRHKSKQKMPSQPIAPSKDVEEIQPNPKEFLDQQDHQMDVDPEEEFKKMASLLLYRMHSKDVTNEDLKYQFNVLVDIQKKENVKKSSTDVHNQKKKVSVSQFTTKTPGTPPYWAIHLNQYLVDNQKTIKELSLTNSNLQKELISSAMKCNNQKDMKLFLSNLFQKFFTKNQRIVANVIKEILTNSKLIMYVDPDDYRYIYHVSINEILFREWAMIKDLIEQSPRFKFYNGI